MKRTSSFVAVVITAAIAGCVPMIPPQQAPNFTVQRGESLQVVDTQYDPLVVVKGRQSTIGYFYGSPEMAWRLFSTFDKKTKGESHAVVFVNRYGDRGWRFWNAATNSNAERLDFRVIDRSVGYCGIYTGCSHTEQVMAFMTEAQVSSAREAGISLRFANKEGGHWPVEYSPDDVQYQMRVFAEATAKYR